MVESRVGFRDSEARFGGKNHILRLSHSVKPDMTFPRSRNVYMNTAVISNTNGDNLGTWESPVSLDTFVWRRDHRTFEGPILHNPATVNSIICITRLWD